jgi:two-component system sensor histidine kinase KdpD
MVPRSRRSTLIGLTVGIGGVVAITVVEMLTDVPAVIPALLLLVPVTACSVLAGWRWSTIVAVVATLGYALFSMEPFGSIEIDVAEDLFVLLTLLAVSFAVGALSNRRSAADQRLLDDRRALLLRGVSHDLRAPLTTIRAISTELLDASDRYGDDDRERMLEQVVDESARLDRIVGNLLSASRIQAGALAPTCEPESLGSIVEQCIRRLRRHGGADVVVDVPSTLPDVLVDAIQIDQVVSNLVENARRHAPAGTVVTVDADWPSARAGDQFVEVSIADEGEGFSPAARDRAFEPFSGDAEVDSSTGLGLAVCRAIVEAHTGTIWLREEGRRGARVSFTLPIAPDPGDGAVGRR